MVEYDVSWSNGRREENVGRRRRKECGTKEKKRMWDEGEETEEQKVKLGCEEEGRKFNRR